jgi:acetyl-CoA decarbonylase/synthase, CODH/ACS complex subunit gamma
MALTGLQIYKLLPMTNCRDCGFPTCLAFAMKLAAKQAELSACPHVSQAAKDQLEAASQPPIRLITLARDGRKVEAGNEIVLYRHEKTFYHQPGLIVRVKDTQPLAEVEQTVAFVESYVVDYVGIKLHYDAVAVDNQSGDPAIFAACVKAVMAKTKYPLVLMAKDAKSMAAGLEAAAGTTPLIYAADAGNWQAMVELAKKYKAPLTVKANWDLGALAELSQQVKAAGVEDIVLDPGARGVHGALTLNTQIRRLALKNFRALGYPTILFAGEGAATAGEETVLAAQGIAKYAGLVVVDHADAASAYPLLTLRQNIYTDPQKPIQVLPGVYEINNPKPTSPVLISTNFSITYFSVANEVEGSGLPAWLLIADADGMSVLTAWAAGKFDADKIAKTVAVTGISDKVERKLIVIPGHTAVLLGELEEALKGWDIRVGPREAVDLPAFMKTLA